MEDLLILQRSPITIEVAIILHDLHMYIEEMNREHTLCIYNPFFVKFSLLINIFKQQDISGCALT